MAQENITIINEHGYRQTISPQILTVARALQEQTFNLAALNREQKTLKIEQIFLHKQRQYNANSLIYLFSFMTFLYHLKQEEPISYINLINQTSLFLRTNTSIIYDFGNELFLNLLGIATSIMIIPELEISLLIRPAISQAAKWPTNKTVAQGAASSVRCAAAGASTTTYASSYAIQ